MLTRQKNTKRVPSETGGIDHCCFSSVTMRMSRKNFAGSGFSVVDMMYRRVIQLEPKYTPKKTMPSSEPVTFGPRPSAFLNIARASTHASTEPRCGPSSKKGALCGDAPRKVLHPLPDFLS